jgi:hypothetical protein
MRHASLSLLLAGAAIGACGCDGGGQPCTGDSCNTPNPPQVFIVAQSENVVGRSFTVQVNVSGCTRVTQLDIQQGTATIKTVPYRGANTMVEVLPGEINRFFGSLGIAADLTIRAHAVCDDNREGASPPVGIRFFPVESVLSPTAAQGIVMPDTFVAEGGVANTPVSFIGCANVNGSLGLVRVNQSGDVTAVNPSPPFGCDYLASITDKVAATGQRWLFEADKGGFAFTSHAGFPDDLTITGGVLGDSLEVFAVGPEGDAIAWDSMQAAGEPALSRIRASAQISGPGTGNPNTVWLSDTPGIVNGTPVVDPSTGNLLVPSWRVGVGSTSGDQTIQCVNYASGGLPIGELRVITQTFAALDPMNPPGAGFSPDGRTIYVVSPVQGAPSQSMVFACGTQCGGGNGCAQRWRSSPLSDVVMYVIPFAGGTRIAAISTNKVWFLDNNSGAVLNPSGNPTGVSGQLTVSGAQVGLGTDFYLLAGAPFATEIISWDNAANGVLWRYSTNGGGNDPQSSMTMAIDEGGNSWLRIGVNQVKPLSLSEYRNVLGGTP